MFLHNCLHQLFIPTNTSTNFFLTGFALKCAINSVTVPLAVSSAKIASIINPTSAELKISTQQFDDFYKNIKTMTMKNRVEFYKLNPDRADVIEPSADIYLRILKWADIQQLSAPSAGLKDGILHELLEVRS